MLYLVYLVFINEFKPLQSSPVSTLICNACLEAPSEEGSLS